MKRIAIGAVTALSVWFGSALAAEAQQITPTGPMSINAGTNNWTFTASIYLPTPLTYRMTTSIFKNGVYQCCFIQNVPNPGTQYSNFTQPCLVTFNVSAGDTVTFKTSIMWNKTVTQGPDWNVQVSPTRPTSKTVQKKTLLAIQGVERDRRRE